jgi:outer membrane protein TolC
MKKENMRAFPKKECFPAPGTGNRQETLFPETEKQTRFFPVPLFMIPLLAAVFHFAVPVFAAAETLSLEQVRSLALANSRSLAKYNLAVQSGVLDERSQLYTNFPSVSLGASASMSLWSAGGTPLDNPLDSFRAGANMSVSQKIFQGGKSLVQQAIKALATESARQDALAEYFNVLDAADSACYAVLEAAADFEAAELALQNALVSLSIAELRQARGIINTGDYLKALADKESRETSRNQARRSLALNTAKLRALIGLAETPQVEEVDFSVYEELIFHLGNISDPEADSLYGEFRNITAAANPALAKAGLSSQRAEQNLSLAKRDFSPSLSASFSTGLNFPLDNAPELSGGSLSISGNIPLDFWVTANNVAKNKIARDSAALDYISAESSLETELRTALLSTIAQAGSVLSSRRALE